MTVRFSHVATAAAIAVGLAFGLGAFTFGYARGYSYLSNDPLACDLPQLPRLDVRHLRPGGRR